MGSDQHGAGGTAGSRRQFLSAAVGTAVAGSGLAGAPVAASARAGGVASAAVPPARRVDLHAHYLAPAYKAALAARDIRFLNRLPVPQWSPALALRFMDDHGIAFQMLSVSDPGVGFVADPAEAIALARSCNDYAASVVEAHPKRFGALALLPAADVAAAQAEAIRALDVLDHDGVGLLSSYGGRYLGDPVFEPLLAELDRRGAWVFVHPTAPAADDRPEYSVPDFVAEYPFDTTRAFISLLVNGCFARHPRIRWHFAHGGGTLPMLTSRLTTIARAAKLGGALLGLPPGAARVDAGAATRALRRATYDTALILDTPALGAVDAMAGARRIVLGTDWPFAAPLYGPKGDPTPELDDVFTPAARRRIDRLNARAAFPRVERSVAA